MDVPKKTTNPDQWAEALFESGAVDRDDVRALFANAIEAGRQAGYAQGNFLAEMLQAQCDAQIDSYGRDPRALEGSELADFITWNAFALIREVGEAVEEHRWKPWLTDGSRGQWYDRHAFVKELVDAWHFFMNLLLASCGPDDRPTEHTAASLAAEFVALYRTKLEVNKARQRDGYDGVKDNGSGSGREVETLEAVGGICAPAEPVPKVLGTANLVDDPQYDLSSSRNRSEWYVTPGTDLSTIKLKARVKWQRTGERQTISFHDGSGRDTIHVPEVP